MSRHKAMPCAPELGHISLYLSCRFLNVYLLYHVHVQWIMSLVVDVKLSASSLHWKEIRCRNDTYFVSGVYAIFQTFDIFVMKITISLM